MIVRSCPGEVILVPTQALAQVSMESKDPTLWLSPVPSLVLPPMNSESQYLWCPPDPEPQAQSSSSSVKSQAQSSSSSVVSGITTISAGVTRPKAKRRQATPRSTRPDPKIPHVNNILDMSQSTPGVDRLYPRSPDERKKDSTYCAGDPHDAAYVRRVKASRLAYGPPHSPTTDRMRIRSCH